MDGQTDRCMDARMHADPFVSHEQSSTKPYVGILKIHLHVHLVYVEMEKMQLLNVFCRDEAVKSDN